MKGKSDLLKRRGGEIPCNHQQKGKNVLQGMTKKRSSKPYQLAGAKKRVKRVQDDLNANIETQEGYIQRKEMCV